MTCPELTRVTVHWILGVRSIGKLRWIFASPTPTLIQCPGQPRHPAQQTIASASYCKGIDLGRMATGTEFCVHLYKVRVSHLKLCIFKVPPHHFPTMNIE